MRGMGARWMLLMPSIPKAGSVFIAGMSCSMYSLWVWRKQGPLGRRLDDLRASVPAKSAVVAMWSHCSSVGCFWRSNYDASRFRNGHCWVRPAVRVDTPFDDEAGQSTLAFPIIGFDLMSG